MFFQRSQAVGQVVEHLRQRLLRGSLDFTEAAGERYHGLFGG